MEEFKRKLTRKHRDEMARVSQKRIAKFKITVKYYLNTKLKPEISNDGEELYPLYFQILIKGKNTVNKSRNGGKKSNKEFNKIEKIINSDITFDFNNFRECINEVRKFYSKDFSELNNSEQTLIFDILTEKMLINEIIKDIRPFENNDYKISDFNDRFDIYHYNLEDSISYLLKKLIQKSLTKNDTNGNEENSKLLLEIIDWNSNPYKLYLYLKETYPSIERLIELYPFCFQIISEHDSKMIPEEREFLKDLFREMSYIQIYLQIKSYSSEWEKETRALGYDDFTVDSINREIHSLFLTQ